MSAEVKITPVRALGVLRNAPFRRYVIGSLISDTGSWMQVMAQGWVMATLTNKAIWLGMANLAAGLPMLLLTMVGGAAADRFDKRKILLVTQFVQIGIACGIGFLVMTGKITGQTGIWYILGFAVVLGISNSFEMPTQSALVPELVGRAQIQNGISIDRSVFHGSRVLGPTLGGYLIDWFTKYARSASVGLASAFFANAISFVALIIAILSLPARRKGSVEEEEKRTSGIKDGFRFVFNDTPSLAMIILIATQSLCIFPIITVMMPLYVQHVLHRGAHDFGSLMGASAIGSFVGAIFLIGLPRDKRVPIMMVNAVAISIVVGALSFVPPFLVVMALLIVNSLALAMNFALCSTIVQERAPDYLRGRVSGVFMLSFVGVMPFAGLGLTALSDWITMPRALAIAAISYGVITLFVLARVRMQCAEPGVCETNIGTPAAPSAAATI